MESRLALPLQTVSLIQISRAELQDFLSQYHLAYRAQRRSNHNPGVVKSLLDMTGLYRGPSSIELIRKESDWFSAIELLIQQAPDELYLDQDGLFKLFLLLRDWGVEKNLTEKGLVSALIDRFDAPMKNTFWKFLCALDSVEIFRVLTQTDEEKSPDDYYQVDFATVSNVSASDTECLSRALFQKVISVTPDLLVPLEFFGTFLVNTAQSDAWARDTRLEIFIGLIQQDHHWFQILKDKWEQLDELATQDPHFWAACYQPDGLQEQIRRHLKSAPMPEPIPSERGVLPFATAFPKIQGLLPSRTGFGMHTPLSLYLSHHYTSLLLNHPTQSVKYALDAKSNAHDTDEENAAPVSALHGFK